MGSIAEWRLKIKNLAEDVFVEWGIALIVLCVALVSFGLGRLSFTETVTSPVNIIDASIPAHIPGIPMGGQLVAARSGSTYYYPWCAGAAKITPQNQRWFASEGAAQTAGYRPAKNCKGLGSE